MGSVTSFASAGPIFDVQERLGLGVDAVSAVPRQIRTQPSVPMNFVESPPGLKVIFDAVGHLGPSCPS